MSIFYITDFGAVPDDKTINTKSIQKALSCCKSGDEVVIPRGVFVSGALFIHGGTKLTLKAGAVLKGSGNLDDYPPYVYRYEGLEQKCYASLINTPDGEHDNIEISGSGSIDGSGVELFKKEMADKNIKRGRVVCIRNTSNCLIKGITICDSVSWTLHFIYCNNVKVTDVKIFARNAFDFWASNKLLKNGDGITFDSCTNGELSNLIVDSQDDCVSIKSGKNEEGRSINRPTDNIFIHDCHFIGGSGIAIGSEMSGGISNIKIENCLFTDVISLLNVKSNKERGGYIDNISISNSKLLNYNEARHTLPNYKGCIYIDACYKTNPDKWTKEGIPTIRNLYFSDLFIMNNLGNPVYICGICEKPIENIRFSNIESYALGDYEISNADVIFENVFNNRSEITCY